MQVKKCNVLYACTWATILQTAANIFIIIINIINIFHAISMKQCLILIFKIQ